MCFYHSALRIQGLSFKRLDKEKKTQEIGQLKMIPYHVLKLRHYGGSPGSLAFFRRMAIAVVVSQGVYAGRHTRRMDWRGRPSCGKQQRHSRGLPLEPVSAELIFPVTSPTFLSPSIYSEPCLLAAGSSPGAGGGGAGLNPFSLELLLSPPSDFQNTQAFFLFCSFVIQRRRILAQSRRNLLWMIEFYFCSPASGMGEE